MIWLAMIWMQGAWLWVLKEVFGMLSTEMVNTKGCGRSFESL